MDHHLLHRMLVLIVQGCIELLERSSVQISGKSACVVGRSNIVGTPAAMLLQRRDATVTVVHSRTPNGQDICSKADIVIAACGKAEMITGDWIKEGAVVIDVGINAVDVSCPLPTLFKSRSSCALANGAAWRLQRVLPPWPCLRNTCMPTAQ